MTEKPRVHDSKVPINTRVDPKLRTRLRRMAHWQRTTVQNILTPVIEELVETAETENGGPFPPTPEELEKAGE